MSLCTYFNYCGHKAQSFVETIDKKLAAMRRKHCAKTSLCALKNQRKTHHFHERRMAVFPHHPRFSLGGFMRIRSQVNFDITVWFIFGSIRCLQILSMMNHHM